MNTWGKRPYSSLPETGSFEELTVKKLKFGDCPVSLPTDCPPINGSGLSFDTNGTGSWSSGPPSAIQNRIENPANTCSVLCSDNGDVKMTGNGGEYVGCIGDEIFIVSGGVEITVYQGGINMNTPQGEVFYTDASSTRLNGPGTEGQLSIVADGEVELVGTNLQLNIPSKGTDKVLTCADDTGIAEWRIPAPAAIANRIEEAGVTNNRVVCENGNIVIEPVTELQVNLESNRVSVQADYSELSGPNGNTSTTWYDDEVIIRGGPGANDASITCFSDNILIETPQLNIALPSNGADKVLTCLDGDGAAEWRDVPPAAIPTRIQDLNGAVVECVTGDVAISTSAAGQVKIGASGVATSKITLESAALQVSIPSVGADKVLTSIDGVGTAEWRDPAPVVVASRIQDPPGTAVVECATDTIAGTINSIERLFVNSTTTRLQSSSGTSNRLELVGNTVALVASGVSILQSDPSGTTLRSPNGNELLTSSGSINLRVLGLYFMPNTAGSAGQVMTKVAGNNSEWRTPQIQGTFSAFGAPVTVSATAVVTPLAPTGSGTVVIPPNTLFSGAAYTIQCGGTLRNNANNTILNLRLGNLPLFNAPITLLNLSALVAWNATFTFVYTNGSNTTTRMEFTYASTATTATTVLTQQLTSVINVGAGTDLNVYAQWALGNANNTITCNTFNILKTF
jgi:hypothetical protein